MAYSQRTWICDFESLLLYLISTWLDLFGNLFEHLDNTQNGVYTFSWHHIYKLHIKKIYGKMTEIFVRLPSVSPNCVMVFRLSLEIVPVLNVILLFWRGHYGLPNRLLKHSIRLANFSLHKINFLKILFCDRLQKDIKSDNNNKKVLIQIRLSDNWFILVVNTKRTRVPQPK